MGISHDIRPKRIYRPKHHQHNAYKNIRREESVDDFKIADFIDFEKKDKLEDDFFRQEPAKQEVAESKNNHPSPKQKIHKILTTKKLVWFFGLTVISIVLYQNFNEIKSSLIKEPAAATADTAAKEENYVSQNSDSAKETTASETTAAQNTASKAATETPAASTSSIADLKIKVLNGNGISNSADSIRDTLVNAGYVIEKVANAKSFSYTKTYIYYKTGKEAEANNIKTVLSGRTCTLDNADSIVGSYDIIVVVGKE